MSSSSSSSADEESTLEEITVGAMRRDRRARRERKPSAAGVVGVKSLTGPATAPGKGKGKGKASGKAKATQTRATERRQAGESRTSRTRERPHAKRGSKGKKRAVVGLLGLPMRGSSDTGDSDYVGSGDEEYSSPSASGGGVSSRATRASGKAKATRTRATERRQAGESRTSRTRERPHAKRGSKGKKRAVVGLLGLPMRGSSDTGGSDYVGSGDEGYSSPSVSGGGVSSRATRGDCADPGQGVKQRRSTRVVRKRRQGDSDEPVASPSRTTARGVLRIGGGESGGPLAIIPTDLLLNGIVTPYLESRCKCALQRVCRRLRRALDDPGAWDWLDLRPAVIGKRVMRSGRVSCFSSMPLFVVARGVVVQPRFERLTKVDLRGINLGPVGSPPDLLLKLFENSRGITSLHLWGAYLEDRALPQPDEDVERAIVEHLPGVKHLALDIGATNKGLRMLLKGCRQLRSLHIENRRGIQWSSSIWYPNDAGMKPFLEVGSPCLESLSLVAKCKIGAAGLKYVLDAGSCPKLKTLILRGMGNVTDSCLEAIIPHMSRITSLVLDKCPVGPSTLKSIVQRCPELTALSVGSDEDRSEVHDGWDTFVQFLESSRTRLRTVNLEIVPQEPSLLPVWLAGVLSWSGGVNCPRRIGEVDVTIEAACKSSADDRIAPYMGRGDGPLWPSPAFPEHPR